MAAFEPPVSALLEGYLLSLVFGRHKKGHFRRISFEQLRDMGLPALVHRRRLILNGRIESPFFIWQSQKATRALMGTVARLLRAQDANASFSPLPQAAATKTPVREGGCLSTGVMENLAAKAEGRFDDRPPECSDRGR
jgi:hypothetical protein